MYTTSTLTWVRALCECVPVSIFTYTVASPITSGLHLKYIPKKKDFANCHVWWYIFRPIINFNKPDGHDFYFTSHILLRCTHLGHYWLSMRSVVAGATFMNESAPYMMQAPPLKRRTCQRFTEIDYSVVIVIVKLHKLNHTTTWHITELCWCTKKSLPLPNDIVLDSEGKEQSVLSQGSNKRGYTIPKWQISNRINVIHRLLWVLSLWFIFRPTPWQDYNTL